jgi:uncharacterized Zn ribbon protein
MLVCDSCFSDINPEHYWYESAEHIYCQDCYQNLVCVVCEEVQDDTFEIGDSIHMCNECRENYLHA